MTCLIYPQARYELRDEEDASRSLAKKLLKKLRHVPGPLRTVLGLAQVASTFAPVPYLKDAINAALFLIDCAQVRLSIYMQEYHL